VFALVLDLSYDRSNQNLTAFCIHEEAPDSYDTLLGDTIVELLAVGYREPFRVQQLDFLLVFDC